MLEIAIRQPTEDVSDLVMVLNEGTARKLRLEDHSWGDKPWEPGDIDYYAESNGGAFYVAYAGSLAVGAFSFSWHSGKAWEDLPHPAGYIRNMAVVQSFQGKGVGAQIVSWAAEEAARGQAGLLRLDCPADNPKLRAHYQNLGFTLVDTRLVASEHPDHAPYNAARFQQVARLTLDNA